MIKQILTEKQIIEEPWQVWNSFVDLVSMEQYDDLTPVQKVGSALFWYNSEVQNGGHMQYLINHGISHLKSTINAFETIENNDFAPLLKKANEIYNTLDLSSIANVEDYVEMEFQDYFSECDQKFYQIEPSLEDILEEYLRNNQSAFIEIVQN